jgi:predicted ribosome quality control (RQC) complex YloA/Tae2 family protein
MMSQDEEIKDLFEKECTTIRRALNRDLKRSLAYYDKCKEERAACLRWEEVQHEAELLQSSYAKLKRGMTQIVVWDWSGDVERTIALDPALTSQEEVASRFKRSKKLRKGIPHIETRFQKQEALVVSLQTWLAELDDIKELSALLEWRSGIPLAHSAPPPTKKEKAPPKERSPYLEYTSAAGVKIWVGRKASDNETLTFSLARGSDWWLHASGVPGSHVVIRTHKGEEPDRETLQDALQLALHYSKAKMRGEGEVSVTQCKYVSRFGKGHVGKVQISKHKDYYARIDPKRFLVLRQA